MNVELGMLGYVPTEGPGDQPTKDLTACIKGLQSIARDHNESIDLLTKRLIKLEQVVDRLREFNPSVE